MDEIVREYSLKEKEELENEIARLKKENEKLQLELSQEVSKGKEMKRIFEYLFFDVSAFLSQTLLSYFMRYQKLHKYLKWLWGKCASGEDQGFCFSLAHKRFLRSVDMAVAGHYDFDIGEASPVGQEMDRSVLSNYNSFIERITSAMNSYKERADRIYAES